MPRRIPHYPHLSESQLHERYRQTPDPVERSRWHFLWLLARGLTATAIARVTGYSAHWIARSRTATTRLDPTGCATSAAMGEHARRC
jgi:Homeodomain-like domain-containing protein